MKRIVVPIVAAVTLVVTGLGAASAAPGSAPRAAAPRNARPQTAVNVRVVNKLSSKCLTALGSGDGAAVTQTTCNGSADQQWSIDQSVPFGPIVNVGTGKCLDLWGNGSADGQMVFTWTCYGASSQQWRLNSKGGAYWELRPYYTNKCLDLQNNLTVDGAVIQQWGCLLGANTNQTWYVGA